MIRGYIAKKVIMAITGLIMLLYLIAHLLGNLIIFKGPSGINAYASILREFLPLLWLVRIIMLSVFLIHLVIAVQLFLDNRKVRPIPYRLKKNLRSSFASRNMIWTGLIIALYIVYHLLNFTIPAINPEFSAHRNIDSLGRPDVFSMVIKNFERIKIVAIYTIAIIAMALHLSHGIQSLFQTLGLNNEVTLPVMIKTGLAASVILLVGFLSIPFAVLTGILRIR